MDTNLFKAQEKTSSVNIVINSFKELLLSKKLLPGQKIPNEMEISTGLGVSRGTVREALKILSAYGIIDIKVGNGTYIAQEAKKTAFEPMLFNLLLLKTDNSKLSEFRKLIECDIIQLIFDHRDENENEIKLLIENVEELKDLCREAHTQNEFNNIYINDMTFHKILGTASKNEMAESVYNFILESLSYSIKVSHQHQKTGQSVLETHAKITQAIQDNNLADAKKAVVDSVKVWEKLQSQNAEREE